MDLFMEYTEQYHEAFDLIEKLCNDCQITIKITYGVRRIVSGKNRKWIVEVMGKQFISENLLIAIGEAFKLIIAVNNIPSIN